MDKLDKLANAVFVIFVTLLIFIFVHYYTHEQKNNEEVPNDTKLVTRREMCKYIDLTSKKPPRFRTLIKSATSGAIRGAFMGLLLNGVEGAITSAIVLGMINPLITSFEYLW